MITRPEVYVITIHSITRRSMKQKNITAIIINSITGVVRLRVSNRTLGESTSSTPDKYHS